MEEVKSYYNKYKIYVLPIGIICASIFALFQVLLPQILSLSESQRDMGERQLRVQKLKDSVTTIKSLSDETLDKNLDVATGALPTNKDILRIYSGLSSAAERAKVSVDRFAFGGINVYQNPQDKALDVQNILVTVTVKGDRDSLEGYINQLYKTFPLIEVRSANFLIKEEQLDLQIAFYFKPYNTEIIAGTYEIRAFTPSELDVLKTVESWTQ